MDTEKEILVDRVIEQIKSDLESNPGPEFVRNFLRLVEDSILNEYLDY
jgi:hypothetical protein